MRGFISIALVTLVLTACAPGGASAQATSAPSRTDSRSIKALRDSIKREGEEISLLQHLLEAATVERRLLEHSSVRAWIVGDPTVRDSLFYALMQADSSV